MPVCHICPRFCKTDRVNSKGFCGGGEKVFVAKSMLHYGEEPCISGQKGSGTIFFGGCNLGCVFCQNYKISKKSEIGREFSTNELCNLFLELQQKGALNINLVTPTHFTPQILAALKKVKPLLFIPVIWNSSGYENVSVLKTLEGFVDVYLPDIKYFSPSISLKYSKAEDYFKVTAAAIDEMIKQTGKTVIENGLIKKGVIIRHLVLPNHTLDSMKILDYIKQNLPQWVLLSLMCQYIPDSRACDFPEINRKLKRKEYKRVLNHMEFLGIENGFIQDYSAADSSFVPNFEEE